jgi:hypothetical protein
VLRHILQLHQEAPARLDHAVCSTRNALDCNFFPLRAVAAHAGMIFLGGVR